MLGTTRALTIEAEIDSRGAQRGARETNKAQDAIARKAAELSRKQVQAQGGVIQQIRNQEREQKKLERTIDGLERKSALYGVRGVERIRAQQKALEAQARAAGATAEQIRRIGAAYDQMASRAAAAQRKTEAARGRSTSLGGGIALGSLATRAGGYAAAAYGIYQGAGFAGGLVQRAGQLSDLPAALSQIANNSGFAESRLRGVVGELQDLDFTLVQAQKSTALFAQAGIPQLLDKLQELGRGARNLSVVSGESPSTALEGLGGAILKGELDLLETQGLVGIKFEDGYKRYAAAVGKATAALTEEEKVLSRLQQVLEKLLSVQGVYERSLDTSGGALRNLSVQGNLAYDALAKLVDPAITSGANQLARGFSLAASAINSLQGVASSPDFKAALAAISAFSNIGIGPIRPFAPMGAIASALGFTQPAARQPWSATDPRLSRLGALAPRGGGGAGSPTGGYYESSWFFTAGVELGAQRSRALSPGSQLNAALGSVPRSTGPVIGGPPTADPGLLSRVLGFSPQTEVLPLNAAALEAYQRGMEENHQERLRQVEDERRAIQRANEQVFQDIKYQSQDMFRAMVAGGDQFWNFWKNAGLTAMSEIFSTQVASLWTGQAGGLGALGGLLGGGVGAIGRPGAPGGTSGFAGPVTSAGSTAASAGLSRGLGLSSISGLGGAIFGGTLALGATQLPGRGRIANAAKGGLAGGFGVGSAFALFPSLLGAGPVGALVGGGIAGGALLGSLFSGARSRARKKVREVYDVTIRDGAVLDEIVSTAAAFGSLGAAVQHPRIRELVQLYAMSTGQDPAGGVTTQLASAVRLRAVNGLLYQDVQYSQGRPAAAASALPLLGVGSTARVNVVNLDAAATTAALESAAYRAVAGAGELVQNAGDRAMRQSAGRRTQAALLFSPMEAVGS